MNLFMVCHRPVAAQFAPMPEGFHIRLLRKKELPLWEAFPFDDPQEAEAQREYMRTYFRQVYAQRGELFFERCLVVVDAHDQPIATCFLWPAYQGRINTLHWLKVLPAYEGCGIGRALLSQLLSPLREADLPLYLHTQPESYRAIKLYSDLGFDLITDDTIGARRNDLDLSLPLLRQSMPAPDFERLRFTLAPAALLDAAASSPLSEF